MNSLRTLSLKGLSKMGKEVIQTNWPNGKTINIKIGTPLLEAAKEAGISIPTGCLGGSCGACEIEINGEVVRACITDVNKSHQTSLDISFYDDPYW